MHTRIKPVQRGQLLTQKQREAVIIALDRADKKQSEFAREKSLCRPNLNQVIRQKRVPTEDEAAAINALLFEQELSRVA